MKYSKNFERDWNWYVKYKNVFTFSGSADKKVEMCENGKDAKFCFHMLDSQGKLTPTTQPELLVSIIRTKSSINFMIKEWAQDRAKGYLPKLEFNTIAREYELSDWMVNAVEQQKFKHY